MRPIIILLAVFAMPAAGFSKNLLKNPGCEEPLVAGEIPYWVEVVGSNWTQRSSDPDPHEGNFYFFAGEGAKAELRQDVDVTIYANCIDLYNYEISFEGYVRSWHQTPADGARVILEYLDQTKTFILDAWDSGEYTVTSEWVQISDQRMAPAGTRHIRVRLISTRYSGTNNDGYFDALSLKGARLSTDTDEISAATGGLVNFALTAGQENAFRKYVILGSISGTSPGTPLPSGKILPLNWDEFTNFVIQNLNTPIFVNFLSVLDPIGNGYAMFNTFGPLPPQAVGITFYFAYTLYEGFDFVSNPVAVLVVP